MPPASPHGKANKIVASIKDENEAFLGILRWTCESLDGISLSGPVAGMSIPSRRLYRPKTAGAIESKKRDPCAGLKCFWPLYVCHALEQTRLLACCSCLCWRHGERYCGHGWEAETPNRRAWQAPEVVEWFEKTCWRVFRCRRNTHLEGD